MTTKNEKPAVTSSVAYIGSTVEKRNGNTYWTRVGVAYKPHGDGKGFTTVFAKGIAVSGEVVWREPKPQEVVVRAYSKGTEGVVSIHPEQRARDQHVQPEQGAAD